ncbi:site-2 protease family protein [Rickettsiella endosymbiont of Dermanyssus gallinae]|uniref:site-2 protease family protein n=1 Tax=Rickettsiella endosymbiont of Dermanyssus gallinae TaxID=2856608 RepID=UPI001C52AF6E|nr:site-2 protease family protein [Rickettsiella endosymbiont of Dermanyssus gallinae]
MVDFSLGQKIILWVIPLIFAITVHETAHGWVASKCGDPTAKLLGRLTLNPIKHIDPIGTIVVPAILFFLGGFIFGWAKPVPITWRNLKNPRRDMALVAAAGPLANLGMAFLWVAVAKLGIGMHSAPFAYMGQIGISINLVLMLLNLIPIPPLDGSRVVASLLSPAMAYRFNQLEVYGFLILVLLLASGLLARLLGPILQGLLSVFFRIFGL